MNSIERSRTPPTAAASEPAPTAASVTPTEPAEGMESAGGEDKKVETGVASAEGGMGASQSSEGEGGAAAEEEEGSSVVLDTVVDVGNAADGEGNAGEAAGQDVTMESVGPEGQEIEPGKRVKVYELVGQEWKERGTGFVEGQYDDRFDEAHLVVWWEADPEDAVQSASTSASSSTTTSTTSSSASSTASSSTATDADASTSPSKTASAGAESEGESKDGDAADGKGEDVGPGGFLRDGEGEEERKELLRTRVLFSIPYQRQQDTLIVWTEPDGTDKALSFQDPLGCNNIWDFIQEVQQHMQLLDQDVGNMGGRSSPSMMSPPLSHDPQASFLDREARLIPQLSLNNLKEQEVWIKMQTRTMGGREKLAEILLTIDYLRQMVSVFQMAEDLEQLEELHCLCSMLQSILALNDNSIFDSFVQDDVFIDLCGILEYDPEYPHYKASYRDFLRQPDRFKEVIPFDDESIRIKIHHTYRLQYLKDVVLARTLDDPTFNIINSLLFFNQIDIITHVQNNDVFLKQAFERFQPVKTTVKAGKAPELPAETAEEGVQKRGIVKLLHSLVNMGKQIQLPNRTALYRKLLEKGLLYVIGWTFRQQETKNAQVRESLGKAVEMLGQILEHDVNAVKAHVNGEKESATGQKSLLQGMIGLLVAHEDVGVKSQMADAIRTLLEIPEGFEQQAAARNQKDGPIAETFAAYFFDSCAKDMYQPLSQVPPFSKVREEGKVLDFSPQQLVLLQNLCELLSGFVAQHGHRSQYFILSQNVGVQVAAVLYTKHKPLRHSALKFFKSCIKTNNHFIHRHLAKNDLMLPLLDILESESLRDNMLTAACLEVTELLRTGNPTTIKTILNYMFEKHHDKLLRLEDRPSIQHFIRGLRLKWEQINEPPPQDTPKMEQDHIAWAKTSMDDEEYFNSTSDEEPVGPVPPSPGGSAQPLKRKRMASTDALSAGRPAEKRLAVESGGSKEPSPKRLLGLNYGDDSDSDSESKSPRQKSGRTLEPSPMEVDEPGPSTPKIKLKLGAQSSASGEELGEFASKLIQKRKRAEEEEEEGGFGSLMSGGRPGTPRGKPEKKKDSEGSSGKSNIIKDATRHVKLRLGGIGRKLGGGGGSSSDLSKKEEKEK